LSLAILVQSGANVLILDEPTNHLDLESREALEAALQLYEGSLLLISHDRALLDAVGSRTIAVEDGSLRSYDGGWPEYVRVREERAELERAAKRAKPAPQRNGNGNGNARRATPDPAPATPPRNAKEAKQLEAEIERAEATLRSLEDELADPSSWNDPRSAQTSTRRHAEAKRELEALYARWEAVAG
jgi:ATP-binding cassette subfamily F protein 3